MDHDEILNDYAQRMSPSEADAFLHRRHGTVSAAIRRGEIRPYRFHDSPNRALVTPAMLAAWLVEFCRDEDAPAATGAQGSGAA